jgi:late competence protein required for DNA uptake (superfamily II DNA/RNA helicase)
MRGGWNWLSIASNGGLWCEVVLAKLLRIAISCGNITKKLATAVTGSCLYTTAALMMQFVCMCVCMYACMYVRGPFEEFVDWRQCAAVMQREAVTYAKL